MTLRIGKATVTEIGTRLECDRESGKIRVYNAETGELLYDLKVNWGTPAGTPEEER